jgi:hypothetical protein
LIKNNRPFIRDAIIGDTGFVGSEQPHLSGPY